MDFPQAYFAQPPELSAVYRSSDSQAQGGIEKLVYSAVRPARLERAAAGADRGAFPADVVGRMRSYIAGNAIKQDIAYLFGLSAVWGKDCITLHNGIVRDILFDASRMRLGDRIIGKGSTHEKLLESGKASELRAFGFVTENGQAANSATAHALKDSVGKYIEADYRGTGVQVYGLSIHDGYHALTLTYGKGAGGSLEYHLIDNGPATSLLIGHRTFETADELDGALNSYVRRDAIRKYRVGKNGDQPMPARVNVYEIYAPRGK